MNSDLRILYEDNHLIAVNKRPGDLAQADSSGDDPLQNLIMNFLKERDQKPGNVYLGTLHRLDKPVTGTVVFAKTSKSAARMSEIIRSKQALKIYLAVTEQGSFGHDGRPERLADALDRPGDTTFVKKGGKPDAFLDIITIHSGKQQLHAIQLISGKKHQIRAQLSSRGCPILGDTRYGSRTKLPDGAIALHCLCMGFLHPVKKEPLYITAPLPSYISSVSEVDPETIITLFGRLAGQNGG
jgi:23S rRNA pseudouridine1911/1915/1917 synthase